MLVPTSNLARKPRERDPRADVLPTTREEMALRGWDQLDVLAQRKVREEHGVKRVYIASSIRYDLAEHHNDVEMPGQRAEPYRGDHCRSKGARRPGPRTARSFKPRRSK